MCHCTVTCQTILLEFLYLFFCFHHHIDALGPTLLAWLWDEVCTVLCTVCIQVELECCVGGWRDAFMSLTELLFTSEMVLRSGGGAGQTICLKFVVWAIDCRHHALNLKLALVFVAEMAWYLTNENKGGKQSFYFKQFSDFSQYFFHCSM